MIEIKNLTKYYGTGEGRFKALDEGSVSYDGKRLEAMNEKELTAFRRAHTAFIFQQYYLLPHLNVEKNVKMGADLDQNKDFLPLLEYEIGW